MTLTMNVMTLLLSLLLLPVYLGFLSPIKNIVVGVQSTIVDKSLHRTHMSTLDEPITRTSSGSALDKSITFNLVDSEQDVLQAGLLDDLSGKMGAISADVKGVKKSVASVQADITNVRAQQLELKAKEKLLELEALR